MSIEAWKNSSLSELVAHVVNVHHAFCRAEMARLQAMFREVLAPGSVPPVAVRKYQKDFQRMCSALSQHLEKEERVLFPLILRLEAAERDRTPPPEAAFGSIANPIRMMMLEHDEAETILKDMREQTGGFTPPEGASVPIQKLYEGMRRFDDDMRVHVELEDVVLFPRAVSLEQKLLVV